MKKPGLITREYVNTVIKEIIFEKIDSEMGEDWKN